MLLSSLREVISNQAQEIQTLQKNIRDLNASNKAKDDQVRVVHKASLIPYLLSMSSDHDSGNPDGIAEKASHRRGGEEEGE